MFDTSRHTLKLLAALVWVIGIVVLFIKSGSLLAEAGRVNPDHPGVWFGALGGVMLGGVKAKYLFSWLCIKNLRRIDGLEQPKIWQCYRLRFFLFLFAMIFLGSFLSQQASGNYIQLIAMAVVELSVGTALLGSSYCFRRE
ncbi:MAG: hypothetical protein ABW168_18010 [Sedimenticola sp.]